MNLSNHNSGSNIDIKNSGRHWSSANPMLPNGEIFIYISFKNRCRIIIAWVSNCYKTWMKLAEDCTKIATIKKPLKIKIHREQSEYELISEAGCSWSRVSQFGIQVKVAWHSRRSRHKKTINCSFPHEKGFTTTHFIARIQIMHFPPPQNPQFLEHIRWQHNTERNTGKEWKQSDQYLRTFTLEQKTITEIAEHDLEEPHSNFMLFLYLA